MHVQLIFVKNNLILKVELFGVTCNFVFALPLHVIFGSTGIIAVAVSLDLFH